MKVQDIIKKKIEIAERRILELIKAGDLKNLPDAEKYQISRFYEEKSRNRLETAKIIYNASKDSDKNGGKYKDYAEVVSAAYYSMYYIVHAFLALKYKTKLREGLRGVHAITEYVILYYLVKTKKLAEHLYDEYLKTFFSELDKRDYLKNSIIMILGDHSFPMGEHYSYAAENGFYSENFKTPLLLIWKGQKNFLGIDHTPRSQLDIPPTILDILNISTVNHFVGSSLFQDKTSFIPLIQPYSGYYIGSLNYPFKYMYHGKTKREFVFNLKHDPQEKNNLIENKNLALIIKKARQDTAKILLNDALIKANQIWK